MKSIRPSSMCLRNSESRSLSGSCVSTAMKLPIEVCLQFAESVMTRWRYVSHPEQRAFLRALLETSAARQEVIGCGSRLWRAQLGQDCYPADLTREEQPAPLDIQRMKPLGDRAREGRA